MKTPNQIRILTSLNPYFRILRAYNPDNFGNTQNICFAVTVGIITVFIPIAIVLAIWHLIADDVAMQKVVIDIPIIITAIESIVTFGGLTINNYKIDELISRLQNTIQQRKCLCNIFCKFQGKVRKLPARQRPNREYACLIAPSKLSFPSKCTHKAS